MTDQIVTLGGFETLGIRLPIERWAPVQLKPCAATGMADNADILAEDHDRLGEFPGHEKSQPALARIAGSECPAQVRFGPSI